MALYDITLKGCDDSTHLELELCEYDAALLQRIARMSRDLSESGCQPTMTIEPHKEVSDE
jgi:hypothetical protein